RHSDVVVHRGAGPRICGPGTCCSRAVRPLRGSRGTAVPTGLGVAGRTPVVRTALGLPAILLVQIDGVRDRQFYAWDRTDLRHLIALVAGFTWRERPLPLFQIRNAEGILSEFGRGVKPGPPSR